MTMKTQVSSLGEKIKKFKMPTFPSALVITFFVLLFVMFLSWIPHKGWIDAGNPFLLFNDGVITNVSNDIIGKYIYAGADGSTAIEGGTIYFSLTPLGVEILAKALYEFGVVPDPTRAAQLALLAGGGLVSAETVLTKELAAFSIDSIVLDNDWDKVAISYSGLQFKLNYLNYEVASVPAPTWLTADSTWNVTIDQIFRNGPFIPSIEGTGPDNLGSFSIMSGTLFTELGDVNFTASGSPDVWFNFWGTDYFMGDSKGKFGILNMPFVLLGGFFNSTGVILYLFCIGAFIEVMLESGALEAGTSALVKKLNGKEIVLIPILFTLFCLGGTTYGMQEETLGLIPLIIPFLILAGFDAMTGLLIVIVGTTTGIGSSVLDPFSVGVMADSLDVIGHEGLVEANTGIIIRIIMFLAFVVSGSAFCTWYGVRSRKGKDFSIEPEMYEANKQWAHEMLGESHESDTKLTKREAWGLGIFGATFALMIFALLPWTNWFPNLENNYTWTLISSFFFAKLVFGEWYFIQLSFMFLLVAFLLGWVFGMKPKDTNKAVVVGMKDMISLGVILTVCRGVEIVLGYSGLTTDMVAMMFAGAGGAESSFPSVAIAWILFPAFAFLAVFISSTSGLAAITGPIVAPILWAMSNGDEEQFIKLCTIVMVTYPLAQGVINMFMPTTGLVVAQAQVARVNFGKALPMLTGVAIGAALIGMTIISISIPIMM